MQLWTASRRRCVQDKTSPSAATLPASECGNFGKAISKSLGEQTDGGTQEDAMLLPVTKLLFWIAVCLCYPNKRGRHCITHILTSPKLICHFFIARSHPWPPAPCTMNPHRCCPMYGNGEGSTKLTKPAATRVLLLDRLRRDWP